MMTSGEITLLLKRGDDAALEELLPVIYKELHSLASALFRREHRADHTLQPTALVHEAYLKLVGSNVSWQDRAHFFGIAARVMRQVLVNHAVARNADKRDGQKTILAMDDAVSYFQSRDIEVLELHQALEKLSALDRRQADIVELKFFGGLTNEETAEVLALSVSTIKREWEMARSWLYRELKSAEI